MNDPEGKKNSSGSSGPEDTMHFTATVQSSQQVSFYFRFLFLRKSGKSRWVSYCLQWFNEFFFNTSALSSETEEVCSDTETIDVSLDGLDANSLAGSKTDKIANLNNRDYEESEEEAEDHDIKDDYDTLMFKAQYIY